MSTILKIENLTKLYKNKRGIKDISLQIQKGEIYGLLGPNGAGKTTTMKILSGLIFKDSGNITIFDLDFPTNFENAMRKMSFSIEGAKFYSNMTAYNNLKLTKNFFPEIPISFIDETLELVGLTEFKNEKVKNYSMGMKQKLTLANSFVTKPELIVLDEPSSGLDIESQVEIRNILSKMSSTTQTSFLISSHNITEIKNICNKISIINNGKILETKLTQDIEANFASLEDYYMNIITSSKAN